MESKRRKLSHARLAAVLPDELMRHIPLLDVHTATIADPRNISRAIVEINERLAVAELQHLKRMRGREMLLFPTSWLEGPTDATPADIVAFLARRNVCVDYFHIDSMKTASVAAAAPKTRRQHAAANALWPCNFHSNKYLENLVENTVFSSEDLQLHTKFLQLALDVRKLSVCAASGVRCGVIVTDPLRNDVIIAGGYSLTGRNPILHAAMAAIDGVARTQNGGAYNEHALDISWDSLLRNYEGIEVLNNVQRGDGTLTKEQDTNGSSSSDRMKHEQDESEYLCTNYHVYMTHEPCAMCAMALIHSRARRVFYVHPSGNGALGTRCKIHAVKDLNHHYEVFRVASEDLGVFQCVD